MTPEATKRAVTDLFARFSTGDIPGVLAMMTEDVTWRLPGRRELLPIAGEYNKERLKRMFDGMLAQLDERGLQMRVVGLVAEGDSVAAEVESIGDLRNDRQYRQQYHFLIRFRDGKIAAVREYLDTQHTFDVWIRQ
jgi:ketosteroid isomerase-like protein